ncbi:hypothetical protein AC578_5730 [Pseudocercospora eumusae]|uniref:Uncharacterized protein n=1 Tax=Pseudocercospora eumusae TaxID=321146 RepID=A0A139HEM7_9PEZI|nr:hypothetical protein AC578_5730 [Pseudocercospora eumusae]
MVFQQPPAPKTCKSKSKERVCFEVDTAHESLARERHQSLFHPLSASQFAYRSTHAHIQAILGSPRLISHHRFSFATSQVTELATDFYCAFLAESQLSNGGGNVKH